MFMSYYFFFIEGLILAQNATKDIKTVVGDQHINSSKHKRKKKHKNKKQACSSVCVAVGTALSSFVHNLVKKKEKNSS